MNISDINPGDFYLVKIPMFGNSGYITKVFARNNDKEYPFEITAARLGVKPEEIFRLNKP